MKTKTLIFDADSMKVNSSNGNFGIEIEADERDLRTILQQIGISTIVSELKDEILDEIGADYCVEHFYLDVRNE